MGASLERVAEAKEWAERLPMAEAAEMYWCRIQAVPHEDRTVWERAVVERLFHFTAPAEKPQRSGRTGRGETWFR